jgi:two-component system OmpR family sensor kinase
VRAMPLPLRVRLTLAFASGMAVVLAALGVFLYARLGTELLQGIDLELRARAQVVLASIAQEDSSVISASGNLIDPDEAFAQVIDSSGRIVDSSPAVAGTPMLRPVELGSVSGPTFFTTRVHGVDDPVRLLAVRPSATSAPLFVVVGATLGDRNEALARLLILLAIGGPLALAIVSWGGWALAGAALRPVERMRVEAAAISASEPEHRLAVPTTKDELARLARTLNSMLDRVHEAADRDRRFLDQASHELRTPLTVVKAELDLALSRPRSKEELDAALRSVSAEVDRLLRLAEDLLVLSRTRVGGLPVRRAEVALGDLVDRVCAAYEVRAHVAGVSLSRTGPELSASLDPVRVRQALEDLLDNAIRYGPEGSLIEVRAEQLDGRVEITVEDSGPGFTAEFLRRAAAGSSDETQGATVTGLGLVIARAIAEAHGGTMRIENREHGGARVTMLLPIPSDDEAVRAAAAPHRR